jgi:hypothetical protein
VIREGERVGGGEQLILSDLEEEVDVLEAEVLDVADTV